MGRYRDGATLYRKTKRQRFFFHGKQPSILAVGLLDHVQEKNGGGVTAMIEIQCSVLLPTTVFGNTAIQVTKKKKHPVSALLQRCIYNRLSEGKMPSSCVPMRKSKRCPSEAPCWGFTWPGSSFVASWFESLATERVFAAPEFQIGHGNKEKKKTFPIITHLTTDRQNITQ